MLTIVLAAFVASLVSGGLKLVFPHSSWSLIFPFLVSFVAVIVFMLRRVGKRMEPMMKEAERHIMGGRRELALKSLEGGLALQRWHPMVAGQIHAQMGALHYDAGKLDEAEAELSRASRWP